MQRGAFSDRSHARVQIAPAGRCNGSPLPAGRREDECDQLRSALGHPDHPERLERSCHGNRRLPLAAGSKEHVASTQAIHGLEEGPLDSGGQVVGDWRKKHVATEQGVAYRNRVECRTRTLVAVENEAAAAGVADHPEARPGEEQEPEVGGVGDGAGRAGGGVGRLDGVELRGEDVEAEERRQVERVQAAEEAAAGDDAAEGGAGRAGAA
jgi:hypothetical protein